MNTSDDTTKPLRPCCVKSIAEAEEHIDRIETRAMKWEEDNADAIEEIGRVIHGELPVSAKHAAQVATAEIDRLRRELRNRNGGDDGD